MTRFDDDQGLSFPLPRYGRMATRRKARAEAPKHEPLPSVIGAPEGNRGESGVDKLRRAMFMSKNVPIDRLCLDAADEIVMLRELR